MKIRIGSPSGISEIITIRGRRLSTGARPTGRTAGDTEMREIGQKISDQIMSGVLRSVIDVSEMRLGRLRDELQTVATLEALKLFSSVSSVMDDRAGMIRGSTIGARENLPWEPLSFQYALWKERYQARRASGRLSPRRRREALGAFRNRARAFAARATNSHFFLDHRLRAYFGRSGPSIVMSRFGGVQVSVDNLADDPRKRRRRIVSYEGTGSGLNSMRVPLGRVRVTIFPRLSGRLMPGLASGRWTETQASASFEKEYLPTARSGKSASIYDKLSGGNGPYRPLVLPITQFFILNRIPDVLARKIDRALGRTVRSNAEA